MGYEEALDPLYHALGMAGKPVSVMDSITGILMVAVYIGIVLVLAAMALNMYTHARHREWGEFILLAQRPCRHGDLPVRR